jgi:hypothetical protein
MQSRDTLRVTVPGWLQIIGAIVAPSSVIISLAVWLVWVRTKAYFEVLGIDETLINFSTQDYLLRSYDVLDRPLAGMLVVGLLMLGAHSLVKRKFAERFRERRRVGLAVMLVAVALLITGSVGAVSQQPLPFSAQIPSTQLSFAGGVALLSYGLHLSRWISTLGYVLFGLLTILILFSVVTEYANTVGQHEANEFVSTLSAEPLVVVYSKERLHIEGPGVAETSIGDMDSGYRYRCTGLVELLHTGGKYLLLPTLWSSADGEVIILSDTPSIRVQFKTVGS